MACNNSATKTSDIEHAVWSHNYKVRFGSASSEASQSSGDICRICHCESDPQNPLLTPCYCSGSLKYVHQACLQQWLTASETNACELCKFPFIMHAKIKPFNEWRSLDISGIERRRLFCSVLFHCAAALCVIWSLCVLIERAADDVKNGLIDWPFWTKLAVVAVGLTGGIVFMYIQCKTYLHLCHRWKARNRILLIQNAPEKMNPVSQSLSPPTQQPSCRHYGTNETYNLCTNGGNLNATNDNVLYAINMPGGGYASTTAVADVTYNNRACMGHEHYETPHHNMMQHSDVDVDSVASLSSARIGKSNGKRIFLHQQQAVHHHQNQMLDSQMHSQFQLGQVAVAANIEYSQQQNYERDFALDDVISQLSSFQPCPQGSGSMTPFHDSIHNVLEHSEDSSRISANDFCVGSRQNLSAGGLSTDTGQDNALQLSSLSGSGDHKAPSISSGVSHAVANGLGGFVYKPHVKLYSNSSIFLENHDLLNDSATMDLEVNSASSNERTNYLHVNMLSSDSEHNKLDQFLNKDMRRSSDTKLLNEYLIQSICCQVPATGHLRQSMQNVNEKESPTKTKADDKSTQPRAKSCIQFNSLPNLTSSCESLIHE